jgi:O-antigen ligase/Tfp pilus assembly protein PilF
MARPDLGPALLLGAAPFVFLNTGGEFENQPKMLFLQWGIAALVLWRLLRREGASDGRRRVDALDVVIVLFYLSCCASLVSATNPARAAVPLVHLAACVLLYFLLSRAAEPARSVDSVLVAAALSCGVVSLIGLMQWGFDLRWIPQAQPPASTFSNRNMAAQFVAICLPLAAALVTSTRRPKVRLLAAVTILVSACYLYVTHARAAWLAVVVVAGFGAVLLALGASRGAVSGPRKWLPAIVLLAIAATAVFAGAYSKRLLELDDPGSTQVASPLKIGTGTARLRLVYWKNTGAMIADRFPGGIGLAQFATVYPLYHRAAAMDWTFSEEFQLERAHNDHLERLAELGLPGFALYVAMWLLFFDRCRRVVTRGEPGAAGQAIFIGLSVIALAIVASFSFPMERAMPPIYLFACMGMVASLAPAATSTRTDKPERSVGSWPRLAIGLVLVVFVVVSGYVMRRAIVSNVHLSRAREALAEGRKDVAREQLELARATTLGDPAVPLLIARGHAEDGRFDRVVEELEYALELHPNKVNAILNLGYAHLQLGQYDEATRYLRRGLEIMPGSLTAISNLGLVHFRQREYDLAIPYYRTVLELAPSKRHYGDARRTEEHVLVAHLQLGGAFAAEGEVDAAIEQYETALAMKPDLPEVRRVLAGLHEQAGRDRRP